MSEIKGKQLSDGGFSKSSTKPDNSSSNNNRSVIGEKRNIVAGHREGNAFKEDGELTDKLRRLLNVKP